MDDGSAVIERLQAAVNAHDLDAIVDCFSSDYVNETPVHPARGFRGRDQVRVNWSRILGSIPNLTTSMTSVTRDGQVIWTEWEMKGTRPDGVAHLMRGVIIFTVEQDHITNARFYLEPVDNDELDVNAAVGDVIGESAR